MKLFLKRWKSERTFTARSVSLDSGTVPLKEHPTFLTQDDLFKNLSRRNAPFLLWDTESAHQPIIYVSPSFSEFSGHASSDLIGHNLLDVLSNEGICPTILSQICEMVQQGELVHSIALPFSKLHSQGHKWHFFPIRHNEDGTVTHYIVAYIGSFGKPKSFCKVPHAPPLSQINSKHDASTTFIPAAQARRSGRSPRNGSRMVVHVTEELVIVSCQGPCQSLFGYEERDLLGQKLSILLSSEEDDDPWNWPPRSMALSVMHQGGTAMRVFAEAGEPELYESGMALPVSFLPVGRSSNTPPVKTDSPVGGRSSDNHSSPTPRKDHSCHAMLKYISHEIRQHLSVMRLGLQQTTAAHNDSMQQSRKCCSEQVNAGIVAVSQDIEAAMHSIERLLDDTLLLATLQEDPSPLHFSLSPVADIVHHSVLESQELFHAKGVALTATVDPSLEGVLAEYDQLHMKQVAGHLLTNACTFIPPGGRIDIRLEPQLPRHDDHVDLLLRVIDNGVGMSAAYQDHLFNPYDRLRCGREQQEGTGLGLAIAMQIVQAHQGTMDVNSIVGKGTDFQVQLHLATLCTSRDSDSPHAILPKAMVPSPPPRHLSPHISKRSSDAKAAAPRRPFSPEPKDAVRSPPCTDVSTIDRADVLVVDDQALVRKYTQVALLQKGYSVALATCGEEVLERYKSGERWRLILSDFTMEEMSGPEMTRDLIQAGCTAPIVGVTGNTSCTDFQTFLTAGAVAVFPKPLRVDDLLRSVARHLR